MSTATAAPSHLFHLGSLKPQKIRHGGTRSDAKASNFPVLNGMSISYLHLNPKGFREPHWHPNAHELSYCIEGKAMMTIFSPGANHDTFIINPGDIAFVPMGYIHHIENIGGSPLNMLVCFNDEMAEDLELSSALGVMPNHILGATFKVDPSYFNRFRKFADAEFISEIEEPDHTELSYEHNRYKMNLEVSNPQIQTSGGTVKMSNQFYLPTLEGLAVYSVCLKSKGAREPHWHPNASELNYLISGNARITLLSPEGHVDTFDMGPGDMSFMPRGYFHHIENTGAEDALFAIFFNHSTPSDIGISGCMGAYSNEILASLFSVSVDYLNKLPKYQEDLFVVSGGG